MHFCGLYPTPPNGRSPRGASLPTPRPGETSHFAPPRDRSAPARSQAPPLLLVFRCGLRRRSRDGMGRGRADRNSHGAELFRDLAYLFTF